jgi:bacteriocin-like protein
MLKLIWRQLLSPNIFNNQFTEAKMKELKKTELKAIMGGDTDPAADGTTDLSAQSARIDGA